MVSVRSPHYLALQHLRPFLTCSPQPLPFANTCSGQKSRPLCNRSTATLAATSISRPLQAYSKRNALKYPPDTRPKTTKASLNEEIPSDLKRQIDLLKLGEEDLSLTRPPTFNTPEDPPRDELGNISIRERARYLYGLGRAYLNFYKRALKLVWASFRASRKYAGLSDKDLGSIQFDASKIPSKEEWLEHRLWSNLQFIQRSRHDVRKMAPFGFVLIICGEFTPLVLLALGSSLVPNNCKVPSQVSQEQKHILTRLNRLNQMKINLRPQAHNEFKNLTDEEAFSTANLLGLSFQPRILVQLLPRNWLLQTYRRRMALWHRTNTAEFNLLPLNSLAYLPNEEIIRLCLLMGHYHTDRPKALDSLCRNVSTNESSVSTSFNLDTSEDNMGKARQLLRDELLQFKRLTSASDIQQE